MGDALALFDVPADKPRGGRPGVVYVCPECWQRVSLAVRLDEPPLCDPCGCRMRLLRERAPAPAGRAQGKAAAPPLLTDGDE